MRPLLVLIALITSTQPAFANLEVHEWGTFTSLVGSDGITQTGMYHEDEALPGFVHPFGEIAKDPTTLPPANNMPACRPHTKFCMTQDFFNSQTITQKMETPVIYFRSDVNQDVSVNVKFPKGVVTETYPAPIATTPTRDTITTVGNGETTFKVKVMPNFSYEEIMDMPKVDAANIYGHARAAKADYVRSGNEVDKFIFYRGVGQYDPLFSLTSKGSDLTIAATTHTPQVSYLIDVAADGDARLMKITSSMMRGKQGVRIGGYQIAALRQHALGKSSSSANDFGSIVANEKASAEIVNGLVQAGLHMDEAQAMVATWERGYLKVPGLRLLSILPREEVDSILPLTVTPTPTSLERVFVSRIEILLQSEEQQILDQIEKDGEKFDITTLGRFAEPKLHRLMQVCMAQGRCNFCGDTTGNRVVIHKLIERAQKNEEQSGSTSIQ